MRIGIDARFYGTMGKGLGRYVSQLIASLEKIDDRNEYVIFLRSDNFGDYVPSNPRFTKVVAEYPWYGWCEQLHYPFWLRKFRLDLMHFPHFNVPILYLRPYVVTIHDLIMLAFPTERTTALGPIRFAIKFAIYRLVISWALRMARIVITVSEFSHRDILEHYPFMRGREMVVTYGAVARTVEAVSPAPRAEEIPDPFLLYVGNAYPHKNLETLLDAFARFRKRGHEDFRLVLVGESDFFYDRLRREAERAGLAENITFFGRATDTELGTLYRRARAYVFASLYEGFGLPPLEAMANGLPVASSDATAMPEILGDAALYFDARDPERIASALERIATDEPLRQRLVVAGRKQSAKYDWDDSARRTIEAYVKAMA